MPIPTPYDATQPVPNAGFVLPAGVVVLIWRNRTDRSSLARPVDVAPDGALREATTMTSARSLVAGAAALGFASFLTTPAPVFAAAAAPCERAANYAAQSG